MSADHPTVPGVTFKSIPGFSSYAIGDDGSVWSCKPVGWGHRFKRPTPWRKLKGGKDHDGYPIVTLRSDAGKKCGFKVARLVIMTFVGPRPSGMECRHLNGDKSDNRLENLQYSDHRTNIRDKYRHGTVSYGQRNGKSKLKAADIAEIRRLRRDGMSYPRIGRCFGVSKTAIRNAMLGKTWVHVS